MFLDDRGNLSLCQWTIQFMHDRDYIVLKRTVMGSYPIDILFFYPLDIVVLNEVVSLSCHFECHIQDKQVRFNIVYY